MKIYDFDGMFDKKISDYIAKNPNKKSQDEWEEAIPKLYEKFGKSAIKALGVSPIEYYKNLSDADLLKTLTTHFNQGISVPQFLTDEIEARNLGKKLLPLLSGEDEQILYALNLIGAQTYANKVYFEMLCDNSLSQQVKAELCELLKQNADEVKNQAIEKYSQGAEQEFMLELLSHCVIKEDKIFNLLVNALRQDRENLSLHASYLATYGDEKAIPYLLQIMEEEGVKYADFTELKYAVEALGGECKIERDFSLDPQYALIKGQAEASSDIFKDIK